jgi:hypothetical protein
VNDEDPQKSLIRRSNPLPFSKFWMDVSIHTFAFNNPLTLEPLSEIDRPGRRSTWLKYFASALAIQHHSPL